MSKGMRQFSLNERNSEHSHRLLLAHNLLDLFSAFLHSGKDLHLVVVDMVVVVAAVVDMVVVAAVVDMVVVVAAVVDMVVAVVVVDMVN